MVFWSAASHSIAMGLTARREMKREAKRLCRLVTGLESVGFEDACLLAAVVLGMRDARGLAVELLHV